MLITLALAWRNLLRNRERSLLTLVGVLLAVGSFVALVSLAEGLGARVEEEFDGRDVQLYLTAGRPPGMPAGLTGGQTGELLGPEVLEQVGKLKSVRHAAGIWRETWLGSHTVIPVLSMPQGSFALFFPRLRGSLELADDQVAFGQGVARAEFVKGLPDTYAHGRQTLKVAGEVAGSGFLDYQAFLPLTSKQGERGFHEVWVQANEAAGGVGVCLKDIEALQMPGLKVFTAEQYRGDSRGYVAYTRMLQIGIASIGVLIAMTAAMNTMLMSTYERLREFAILRAIGASRFQVASLIVWESVLLCWVGGTLGLFFGLLCADVLDKAIVVLFQIPFPLAKITARLTAEALALSGVIGLVGSVLPAVVVWRLKLADGLRWD